MSVGDSPGFSGVHHVSLTVSDLQASVAWYEHVLGGVPMNVTIPHYGCEDTGYAVLLVESRSGLIFGLHTNSANRGERFDEARTGLDHVSFGVAGREALQEWTRRLDELGIPHTGVVDETEPFPYSTVVFRDPDNIQLEFIAT